MQMERKKIGRELDFLNLRNPLHSTVSQSVVAFRHLRPSLILSVLHFMRYTQGSTRVSHSFIQASLHLKRRQQLLLVTLRATIGFSLVLYLASLKLQRNYIQDVTSVSPSLVLSNQHLGENYIQQKHLGLPHDSAQFYINKPLYRDNQYLGLYQGKPQFCTVKPTLKEEIATFRRNTQGNHRLQPSLILGQPKITEKLHLRLHLGKPQFIIVKPTLEEYIAAFSSNKWGYHTVQPGLTLTSLYIEIINIQGFTRVNPSFVLSSLHLKRSQPSLILCKPKVTEKRHLGPHQGKPWLLLSSLHLKRT